MARIRPDKSFKFGMIGFMTYQFIIAIKNNKAKPFFFLIDSK